MNLADTGVNQAAAERRRRLARALDDCLPDTSRDETSEGWGEPGDPVDADQERLQRDVPPHHG